MNVAQPPFQEFASFHIRKFRFHEESLSWQRILCSLTSQIREAAERYMILPLYETLNQMILKMNLLKTPEFWYFFIPLVFVLIFYFKDKSLKDERKHLMILFKANQTISNNNQRKLKHFIEDYNAYDAIAFPERNLTYGTYYEMMVDGHSKNLSDELYEFSKNKKLTKPTIQSMTESLNRQNENLRLMEIDIELVIKKASEGRI